jgi:ribosomal protein L30E
MQITVYRLSLLLLASFWIGSCSSSQKSDLIQVNSNTQPVDNTQVVDGNHASEGALNGLPVRYVLGNAIQFNTVSELEQRASLIIIGKTTANFEDSQVRNIEESKQNELDFQPNQSITIKDAAGLPVGFYSITSVKINKVLKGSTDLKEINVIQAGAVSSDGSGKQIIIANEGSTPLQKNLKYILFLAKVDTKDYPGAGNNTYSILSINQGKFNLDQKDVTESKEEVKSSQYKALKKQVSEKYKKDFDSSPE